MTYTCTVAWCAFDGRSLAALRRHIRQCHPWLYARMLRAEDGAPCALCGDPNGCRETPSHHARYLASR